MLAMLLFLIASQADLLSPHGEKAVVLFFVRSDCPISNRYAPDIRKLYEKYSSQGIEFHLIYSEPGLTASAMERHRQEYGYTIPALLDPDHRYVSRAGAHVTPEAAVFAHGDLIYLGRIDDRYVDVGKARLEAKRHDLEEVLITVLAGQSLKLRQTKAVGCAIERVQ
jgi:thiol-disulfide isomerase/thioredoxin